MSEMLLGGSKCQPASDAEKREFKRLVNRDNLTDKEWSTLQRIEWGLTKSEYIDLKFGGE